MKKLAALLVAIILGFAAVFFALAIPTLGCYYLGVLIRSLP